MQRQLPKGSTYYFLNEPVIRLAEKMVDACPCADQVHFTGSGTEATFFALRMARASTGRDRVLKFEGGWHGMNDYGLWGTVPSQALWLMNNAFVREQSRGLARRLMALSDDRARVIQAYELCFARPPSSEEIDLTLGYLARFRRELPEAEAWASVAKVLMSSNEFVYID